MEDTPYWSTHQLSLGGVLDWLQSLVDKSLVLQVEAAGGSRFTMLETVREYALERLVGHGEVDSLRRRHAEHFLALAEEAEPQLESHWQAIWLDRLEVEHDNCRAALQWFMQDLERERGLRLAAALSLFWFMRGYFSEGRERLTEFVSLNVGEDPAAPRARALNRLGILARYQGEFVAAYSSIEESLKIWRTLGDQMGKADALNNLGAVAFYEGDLTRSRRSYEEALLIHREAQNAQGIADVVSHLGLMALYQGDFTSAFAHHQESLAIWRRLGDQQGIAWALTHLATTALYQGNYVTARRLLHESLLVSREIKVFWVLAYTFEVAACLAAVESQFERAALLTGAAAAMRDAIGTPLPPTVQREIPRRLALARTALGETAWAAAVARGWELPPEQAIACALDAAGGSGEGK